MIVVCNYNCVIILYILEPGKLEFAKPSIIAKESGRHVRIPVNRIHGADGHVSVKWEHEGHHGRVGGGLRGRGGDSAV